MKRHRSKWTMKILHSHYEKVWGVGEWPENSPDLNPIEKFGLFSKILYIEPIPTTINALKIRLDKIWNSLCINLLKKLSENFKSSIEQMIINKGAFTKYWSIKFTNFKFFIN